MTWRLSGSLPREILERIAGSEGLTEGKRFVEFDRHLDRGLCGPDWLRIPEVASIVVNGLREAEQRNFCKLQGFVVMPNHVHVLLEPKTELRRITKWIKGSTGRAANQVLGREGKFFWQDESFDHWVRNSAQFERVRTYIERNPVAAGLVKEPGEWRWSSASREVAQV